MIGFVMLNLTKEKEEDEMIRSGFYWLIWGIGAIMPINYVRFRDISSEIFTAYLVLILLNAYVYGAIQYQKLCISAIIPVALFSLLIGTEDRRRLPAGRQGRPKRPNISLLPIIFLSFLPTGKVADNQIKNTWLLKI